MTAQIITLADENMLFSDAIALAEQAGMFLITNGQRSVISPVIPLGWAPITLRGQISLASKKAS